MTKLLKRQLLKVIHLDPMQHWPACRHLPFRLSHACNKRNRFLHASYIEKNILPADFLSDCGDPFTNPSLELPNVVKGRPLLSGVTCNKFSKIRHLIAVYMNGARLLMGFSVTMNLIENPLSDEKPSLKWDATVFLKTRKTNILMHRR